MKINWNYPTLMWVGENRSEDIIKACKQLEISNPLFVTDKDLINLDFTNKIPRRDFKIFTNKFYPIFYDKPACCTGNYCHI